jgi:hypothetical protein
MRVPKLRGGHLLLAAVALLAASCGGGEGGAGAGGGAAGAGAVTILEPANGAQVQVPFMLKVKSDVELGPTEKGVHHIHVFFDGDDSKYEVVEADTFEVKSLPPGKHAVNVSLRNADHSPAGSETKVDVEVTGGGGGNTESTSSDTGRDYDY